MAEPVDALVSNTNICKDVSVRLRLRVLNRPHRDFPGVADFFVLNTPGKLLIKRARSRNAGGGEVIL